MKRALTATFLVLSLAGCTTTGETVAKAKPSIVYDSTKPPFMLAECIVSRSSEARFMGTMMDPPTVIHAFDGLRLHWLRSDNVFATVTPVGEGSHLEFYFDTLIGVAQRGIIERSVRACQ